MTALLLLLPVALGLGMAGLMAFLWSLRDGQFEDLDGAAGRILFDDETPNRSVAPAPSATPPVKRRTS